MPSSHQPSLYASHKTQRPSRYPAARARCRDVAVLVTAAALPVVIQLPGAVPLVEVPPSALIASPVVLVRPVVRVAVQFHQSHISTAGPPTT